MDFQNVLVRMSMTIPHALCKTRNGPTITFMVAKAYAPDIDRVFNGKGITVEKATSTEFNAYPDNESSIHWGIGSGSHKGWRRFQLRPNNWPEEIGWWTTENEFGLSKLYQARLFSDGLVFTLPPVAAMKPRLRYNRRTREQRELEESFSMSKPVIAPVSVQEAPPQKMLNGSGDLSIHLVEALKLGKINERQFDSMYRTLLERG